MRRFTFLLIVLAGAAGACAVLQADTRSATLSIRVLVVPQCAVTVPPHPASTPHGETAVVSLRCSGRPLQTIRPHAGPGAPAPRLTMLDANRAHVTAARHALLTIDF